jgi:hypothetical protein
VAHTILAHLDLARTTLTGLIGRDRANQTSRVTTVSPTSQASQGSMASQVNQGSLTNPAKPGIISRTR